MDVVLSEDNFEQSLEAAKNELENGSVTVVGKGKLISKAVDVAEELKISVGAQVKNISIETEEGEKRISVIKIELVK